MPEFKITGYAYIETKVAVEHIFTADNEDDAYDVAYDYCVSVAEDTDGTLLDTDYEVEDLTPPAPSRERMVITRPDGTTYTCYGVFEEIQGVTETEASGVQGTRATDPIVLPNGRPYRPYGAVERA